MKRNRASSGVVEGSTENASVVRGLIAGLRDRGLDTTEGTLFVLDGGKARTRAVRDVFSDYAVIPRCRVHKERNVLDHLPDKEQPWVRRKLRAKWANPGRPRPRSKPWRASSNGRTPMPPPACEGPAETLTVTRLGVTGSLLKTVMSTNPVESSIEIVRHMPTT